MRDSLRAILAHMLSTEDFWIVEVAQGRARLFDKRPTIQSGAEFVAQMDAMRAETERYLLSLEEPDM